MLPNEVAEIKEFFNASRHALAEAARTGVNDPAIVVVDVSNPLAALVASRLPYSDTYVDTFVIKWASKALITEIMDAVVPGSPTANTIKEQMQHDKPFLLYLGDHVKVAPWDDEKKLVVSVTANDPQVHPTAARRSALIDCNREKIELAYEQASAKLGKPALVLVLDLTDDLCRSLASNTKFGNAQYLDNFVSETTSEGNVPTMIVGLGQWQAYKTMRTIQHMLHQMTPKNPQTSEVVEQLKTQPPDGYFWCLCISKGKQLAPITIPH